MERNDLTIDIKGGMFSLTEKEKKLIEVCREISYGQVTIFMENGQPVRVELIKESVKL